MPTTKLPGDPPAAHARRIVLVHGAGQDGSVWDLQTEILETQGFRVLAPDLPGHGACIDPALPDIQSMAMWLIDRLRSDSWSATAIAGHSMGSLIALEACARAPELFTALVLIGTACPMPVAPALLQAAAVEPDKAHTMINKWSFAQPVGEPDPACRLRAANLALMRRQGRGILANDLTACNAYADAIEAATRVSCPCTLICGERDRMTPPEAAAGLRDALARNGRNVAIITLEGAGHAVMLERPAALARAIRESSVLAH